MMRGILHMGRFVRFVGFVGFAGCTPRTAEPENLGTGTAVRTDHKPIFNVVVPLSARIRIRLTSPASTT
jgi:hypothetical protein